MDAVRTPPPTSRPSRLGRCPAPVAVCLLLAILVTPAVVSAEERHRVRTFSVGDARIDLVTTEFPRPPADAADSPRIVFVNVHDDEDTSVEAAVRVLRDRGGRLVQLRHSGDREIGFVLDGTRHRIDPNRIFTPVGRRATLEALSSWSQPADDLVASFADQLLATLDVDDVDLLVALHNNTPDRYTAASYAAGGPLAADAARIHLQPGGDPDDFFFVTDAGLFAALADRGHAVVLQNEATVADDGSLSVWAGRLGIPYVNVEAEHGHLEEQAKMLRDLLDVVADRGVTPDRARPRP